MYTKLLDRTAKKFWPQCQSSGNEGMNQTEVSGAKHWFSGCSQWRRFYPLCSPQMHINLQLSEILPNPPRTQTSPVAINWSTSTLPCLCQSALPVCPASSPFVSLCLPVSFDSSPSPAVFPQNTNPVAWESGARGSASERDWGWTLAYCQAWQHFYIKPPREGILISDHLLKHITFTF